ncbi:uncharacterized protein LOC111875421 isoform X2 [Cryptotermes secundus]|uniref:uncharacterized protein LOC111875421 isoform X2 n=1 Tax=Cryptotermes secundus TaxID=105785 RepID=UPI001454E1E0|nr:uncharacterized protein LOC111875421 isoform X2 [Cryptotermes secundus]
MVIFTMLSTTTCRLIILMMIWLYHLATSLNINTGYYINPFFRQPLNLQRTSVPQLIWSTYTISSGQNTVATWDRFLVDNQNHDMSRKTPFVGSQNHMMTRENPVVYNQNHYMTRENPVVDSQNHYMTLKTPFVDHQNHTMTRENSVVVNQDQNLEDYSFKHIQPKCSRCPHQGTKELTNRGGFSVKFVKDSDVQQGEPGGGHVLFGNETNNISADSTKKLLPPVADPSRCVWAIISCCSPGSSNVRNPCFELLGCPGPFWDTNPCNERITGAALKVVGEFYSNGKW